MSNEPATQSITGTGRFLTRSTCASTFLGASLQALVHAELVGALLDGKDRSAGGDALRQGGGAGGRHWGVVRIVIKILWHMPRILVLVRVMRVIDIVQVVVLLFVLVLMHRDLLDGNTTREFPASCDDGLLCCGCWPPCGCGSCGGCSPRSRPPRCTPCCGGAGLPLGGCLSRSRLWLVGHHPKPFLP